MIPFEFFAPPFKKDVYTEAEKQLLAPFFSNLDQSVYVPYIVSPELIGAICSRASRATHDLRYLYLKEFVEPFVDPIREEKDTDDTWNQKLEHGAALKEFIEFLRKHPFQELFANPRARSFYVKWLAQYGDDSIAQMAGAHLVFSGLSQVALKHIEDQRIGLAPIEKSTRYVNYGARIDGTYLYYTDPALDQYGVKEKYERVMDQLFDTYNTLVPRLSVYLQKKFPEEKLSVIEKKTFDTLRGLLPTSALSQAAFFGNGQAFEYMISRCAKHQLGEVRWVAQRAYQELNTITPAFLRRIKDEERSALVHSYQEYLSRKNDRVAPFIDANIAVAPEPGSAHDTDKRVQLIEYDPAGEEKVITGILYAASNNHCSWNETQQAVQRMDPEERDAVLAAYLRGRSERWQKVGRAFENVYVRFDILMNIGAWRDIHRHRMLTQERQLFTSIHGFDTPQDIIDAELGSEYCSAIEAAGEFHRQIAVYDPWLAQYCVTLSHRLRFMQWENLRECFWEIELRTIPEGHPDYRAIEQEKFSLLEKVYPLITKYMHVNVGQYEFARRGQEERIQKKLTALAK